MLFKEEAECEEKREDVLEMVEHLQALGRDLSTIDEESDIYLLQTIKDRRERVTNLLEDPSLLQMQQLNIAARGLSHSPFLSLQEIKSETEQAFISKMFNPTFKGQSTNTNIFVPHPEAEKAGSSRLFA